MVSSFANLPSSPLPVVACHGIAWWKRRRIRAFLQQDQPLRFFLFSRFALSHARKKQGAMAVWANHATPELQQKARAMAIPLLLVEDGFIRSIGLGCGFLPPCSIIVDRQGAYVDPSHPSDLETLLNEADIPPAWRARAARLIDQLHCLKISKYAGMPPAQPPLYHPAGRRIILVPGQVAGDLSVMRGGGAIKDNLSLLQAVRHRNPDAWIIYRPHPDVEAGHRAGNLPDGVVLAHANSLHRGGSMGALLEQVDEVHTLTSLTGFEALLRGKAVTTYGAPFYAGWGLTTHLGPALPRRNRKLDVVTLVAITLILYPLYLNPETGRRCEVEELIACFAKPALWSPSPVMRLRQLQGRVRHFCIRFLASYRTPHA